MSVSFTKRETKRGREERYLKRKVRPHLLSTPFSPHPGAVASDTMTTMTKANALWQEKAGQSSILKSDLPCLLPRYKIPNFVKFLSSHKNFKPMGAHLVPLKESTVRNSTFREEIHEKQPHTSSLILHVKMLPWTVWVQNLRIMI